MLDVMIKKTRRKIKGTRTHEKILQSAIFCIAHAGHEKTTFQTIADHCGISQPLVVHYFKKRTNVFPHVVDYLVNRTQYVIQFQSGRSETATQRLRKFIRISLSAVREDTASAKVFLTLSFLAAFEESYRDRSGQIKQMVANELVEILAAGIKSNEFEVKELLLTSRLITAYLSGVRMTMLNENSLFSDESMIRAMEDHCLKIVGATSIIAK